MRRNSTGFDGHLSVTERTPAMLLLYWYWLLLL